MLQILKCGDSLQIKTSSNTKNSNQPLRTTKTKFKVKTHNQKEI